MLYASATFAAGTVCCYWLPSCCFPRYKNKTWCHSCAVEAAKTSGIASAVIAHRAETSRCLFSYVQNQTHLQVELMIQMPVNFLGITILPEKPPQHTQSSHPQNLGWQTSLTCTPPLTYKTQSELRFTCFKPPGTACVTYRIQCACPSTWPLVLPLHETESGSSVAF